ncbi:VWA domain-containing protein [Zavarzinia compransoris]|uniref:VWFA domain-containing protein n=1 Tax=Zavarzinia compransoris TaxID=1264899 RepID=A0A317E6W9_9PROT|nr:VWA domain-containing protein [Zavarzinia compransoris]PWR22302.1 hypothetical protein DKG75_10120 [Zavarzinia compransoris]TDP46934.1 Ca-activated chloride channel family protein [Zavarzinia compransoris]
MAWPQPFSRLRALATALGLGVVLALAACDSQPAFDFTIVAGSENQALEPIVQDFCRTKGVTCTLAYQGSLDIGLSLRPGQDRTVDAVWPAASLWIDLFDSARAVTHRRSISQNPVVLGVRKAKAEELGWTKGPVTTKAILEAVEAGRLRFFMTSATQSNSGSAAYLAMLAAARGKPLLEAADLDDPDTLRQVRALLRGVERSSGSSGWLADLYLQETARGAVLDAMWNYEAVIKETNDALRAKGKDVLWAVYPAEGVAVADSPLGFVERGRDKAVEEFFVALQAHLLSPEIQAQIAATGRRVALGGGQAKAEADWNFDPERLVTAIPTPEPGVIRRALALYQEALRRPSLTVLCLDFSGSMEGEGIYALRQALQFLFTPERAAELLVQWSAADRIVVIPFSGRVGAVWDAAGTAEGQARLLAEALAWPVGGGTDIYACIDEAYRQIERLRGSDNDYLPAIAVMTDGVSEGSADAFLAGRPGGGGAVPVFGVTFGNARRDALDILAKGTGARVFDGTKDLTGAFRSLRGYN